VLAAALFATTALAVTDDTIGPDGSTPLQRAAFHSDVGEVKRLLAAGADAKQPNAYGVTPLALAAETGNADIIKLLLAAGADVESPSGEGQTALMSVARTGNVEAAQLLIKRGANVNAAEKFGGQTALMWAAARRHPDMVKLLASKGADVNARAIVRNFERHITVEQRYKNLHTGGLTPLLYAVRENCKACVDALLQHKVDILLPDPDGIAPLTLAMMNGNWDIAKRLLEAGADMNQWDIYGQAPLHVAIENAYVNQRSGVANLGTDKVPNVTDGRELVRLLVEKGRRPEPADVLPRTEGDRPGVGEFTRHHALPSRLRIQRHRADQVSARAWRGYPPDHRAQRNTHHAGHQRPRQGRRSTRHAARAARSRRRRERRDEDHVHHPQPRRLGPACRDEEGFQEGDGRARCLWRESGHQGRRRPDRAGQCDVARLVDLPDHAAATTHGSGQGVARSRRNRGAEQGARLARRVPAHRSAACARVGDLAAVSSRRQFLGSGVQLAAAASMGLFAPSAFAARDVISAAGLAPGMTLLSGAGCNVVAVKGPDGSLLVDGGYAKNSQALLKAAARATGNRKVATLINTHWHPAQTGSNEAVGRAGGVIIAHEVTRLYLNRPVSSVDYEGLYGPLPAVARPTKTTRRSGALTFAGQPVQYDYLPAAHTSGDLFIHFPAANVIVAGGPVCSETWPLLDYRNGAWLGGLVKAHEKLAALAKPDTRIVPANGRVMTGVELSRQHQMFAVFHEQMVVYLNKGMDSGDVIADHPLKAYEDRYGDSKAFIHGAFTSLNLAYSPD
jgi:ankyrin repeat protein/glyoxylase-like metal-dependent hydrolase (beta-lactamase superfamily II)